MSKYNPYRNRYPPRPKKVPRYETPVQKALKEMNRERNQTIREMPYLITPERARDNGDKMLIRYKNGDKKSSMRGIVYGISKNDIAVIVTVKRIRKADLIGIVDEERMKEDAKRRKNTYYL